MKAFEATEGTRSWLVVINRGEYVIEELTKFVEAKGINTGLVVGGIGSFDILKMHTISGTTLPPGEHYYQLEGPIECGSMQGSIAGGVPHVHIVVDDVPNHTVHVGHLEEGSRVNFRCEVGIIALDGAATKTVLNKEINLAEIVEA